MEHLQQAITEEWFLHDNDTIMMNKELVVQYMERTLQLETPEDVRSAIAALHDRAKTLQIEEKAEKKGHLDSIDVGYRYFLGELKQILNTRTLTRLRYYLRRLIKSLSEVKTPKINDINLYRWKEYEDLITDSLWSLERRDNSGAHLGWFWGNFVPQIPNQLLRRFTQKGDWVLDTFLGSGTTLIECRRLGRNGIGIELQADAARHAGLHIEQQPNEHDIKTEVVVGNSAEETTYHEVRRLGVRSVQFVLLHPPYWNILEFSKDERDLSNANSLDEYLRKMGKVFDHTYPLLDRKRFCAVVIGDKYEKGEWIPLGFLVMQEALKRGYKLKSVVVKNFEETRGKTKQKELWRYRAMVGGFYVFKHEYILLFQKP